MAHYKNIVFVCTGNTCRSPMAAALLQAALQERKLDNLFSVSSAGVAAGTNVPAADSAIVVMARDYDLDISSHRSTPLNDETVASATYIIAMTSAHKREILRRFPHSAARVYTLGEFIGEPYGPDWDVQDPFGGSMDEYTATANTLHKAIRSMADRLQQQL